MDAEKLGHPSGTAAAAAAAKDLRLEYNLWPNRYIMQSFLSKSDSIDNLISFARFLAGLSLVTR